MMDILLMSILGRHEMVSYLEDTKDVETMMKIERKLDSEKMSYELL